VREQELEAALQDLVEQVRVSGAKDDHGHLLEHNAALANAEAALKREPAPIRREKRNLRRGPVVETRASA
jgi:hypothetical protein